MASHSDDDDWQQPLVAPRHQVLLVDVRPGGQAALLPVDDATEPWPVGGLKFLAKLLREPSEVSRREAILDRFDAGAVPRLLRLALCDSSAAAEALELLSGFASSAPEVAAEVLRSHAHVVQHFLALGPAARRSEQLGMAAKAAGRLLETCRGALDALGEGAEAPWLNATPLEDQHWLAFGGRHYVLRFAAACSEVPLGALPPPASPRLFAFGRTGEEGVADAVGFSTVRRRLATGGRLWCSGLLLAREVLTTLAEQIRGRRILDLGCGLGFAGLAAVLGSGAEACVLADIEPSIVEAARTNVKLAGHEAATRCRPECLDARDLEAVRRLAQEGDVSVVLASDLVYGPLSLEEVAQAVAAGLPRGGVAWLLFPAKYRTGMDSAGLGEALAAAGLAYVGARRVDHGQAHFLFTACEESQEYILYEAKADVPKSLAPDHRDAFR